MNKPFLPRVDVYSVDEYFKLPKDKREKYGIYLLPEGLPADFIDNTEIGWDAFSKEIRKHYPIQGFIREWVLSHDNPVYSYIRMTIYKIKQAKYIIKLFLNPIAPRFRKSLKRWEYKDISNIILDSNFALLLDFWYEEVNVKDCFVDYVNEPSQAEFYKWLKNSVEYIEKTKNEIEKRIDILYSDYKTNKDEINILYKEIEDSDTKLLKEIMEKRGNFWT